MKLLLLLVSIVPIVDILAQEKLTILEVQLQGISELAVPAQVNLGEIASSKDLQLVDVKENKRTAVPFQIVGNKKEKQLIWMVEPDGSSTHKRVYELTKKAGSSSAPRVHATKNDRTLVINTNGKNLLQYNHATVYPPTGVDSVYKRSAFIHPLWSPHGQVLTRIQPPDHYHHYGIWNPWTHILYAGDTLDLWNLNKKQGTVRFAGFQSIDEGSVFAGYSALHEHIAFIARKENVILNEIQSVRVYQPSNYYYITDITIELTCASTNPVTILEYRYAGLGWRTTEQWTKDNSHVLTSEGKTRKDADGSRARWCLVQGLTDGVNTGVLMMSSPDNYSHPEPLRIWPENQYNRGDMFANFNPAKERDWILEPGKTYTLKYRLLVFNGPFTKEKAEQAWNAFAKPAIVTVKKK